MIVQKKYTYPSINVDNDVIHLFEHLVLHSFINSLEKAGLARSLLGWVNGQTTDNNLIFDLGVYQPSVISLFEQHIKCLTHFSHEEITRSLNHIKAEMMEVASITSFEQLNNELDYIINVIKGNNTGEYRLSEPAIVFNKQPHEFHLEGFLIKLPEASVGGQILFLGINQIIVDILRDSLEDISAYPVGLSNIIKYSNTIGVIWQVSIRNSVDAANLATSMQKMLRSFEVKKYQKQFIDYFYSYLHDDIFSNIPDDYYDQTGIRTTRNEVAKNATIENITNLLQAINISVAHIKKKNRLSIGLN